MNRLDYLDAVRAFALLLGIVFHASLSFTPIYMGWAVMDVSTGALVPAFMVVSHSFRMGLFFLVAGYFSRMSTHRNGARAFVGARLVRIGVPFVVGWFVLRPLLASGWVMGAASLRGEVDILAGLREGFASLQALPSGIFTGSHLWFLYYLALVTGLMLGVRWGLSRGGSMYAGLQALVDGILARVARMGLPALAFVVPTAMALWYMSNWGMDTPDRSLVPHVPVTIVYGTFFGVGWALQRSSNWLEQLTRLSVGRGVLALLAMIGVLLLAPKQMDLGDAQYLLYRGVYVVCYAALMWSLSFLTIGVFRKLITRGFASVRYLADSSYWLYLAHLPVVVWLQVAVAELPWHWSIKLMAISALTVGISLALYELFVRATIVGKVLNGRRRERALFGGREAGVRGGVV